MRKLPFYIVDVFAEKKYAGNQLAVFRRAESLSGETMQQIARETNFSETTFILRDEPRDNGFDVRIFTPAEEVPFAGHPTLGTAHIIRSEILKGEADELNLNLKVGKIPVTFATDGYIWMRQIEPEFGKLHPAAPFTAMLNVPVNEIDDRFPVQEVSTGLPFFIVPLKSLSALKAAKIDREKYFAYIKDTWAKGVLVFCPQAHEAQNDISVRVFVDCFNIPEDPATGSGNGCLAGYLVKHRYFGSECIDVRSEQGYEIGRPSLLLLKAEQAGQSISISVGGKAMTVAKGKFV
ncbi:MAG: PhzF family phenazine biosynthesis protein [Candidatus Aminicenantes bacterium]|nr:PhzF family phenazine biosynthesis protein [Candidatus Aminicenantes bacterium]